MVVALIALFIALGGPATAARLIDGGSIRPNSITSSQIRNRTLRMSDLASSTVRGLRQTPRGGVATRELAPRAVDASKLATGSVGTAALADKGVGADDLADGAVGPMQIAPAAVTSTKLAEGSVGSAAIADGSLRTRDIGDFAGAVQITFDTFVPNSCQASPPLTPTQTASGATALIADDVIIVTPPVGWPDQLTVSGHPGAQNTLRVIMCNPTGTAIAIPGADTVPPIFRYLGIDQP
jgi:hypothetical protein